MRVVLQRVKSARVCVEGRVVGEIDRGLLILAAIAATDGPPDLLWMVEKLKTLRVFDDAEGKMNLSLEDVGGAVLLVSQFTLFGECRKGRRPDFTGAAPVAQAAALFDHFVKLFRETGLKVETGVFRAMMDVELVNDGPVTLILESPPTKS